MSDPKQLFVPFPEQHFPAGGITFLNNLRNHLQGADLRLTPFAEDAHAIFFNRSFDDLGLLRKFRDEGGRVIQRLDGIELKRPDILEHNYRHDATHIVFQSQFCKRWLEDEFQFQRPPDEHSVIINGVDPRNFHPAGDGAFENLPNPFVFITAGHIRQLSMLQPLIYSLDHLVKEVPFELRVAGRIKEKEFDTLVDRPYIRYLGDLSPADLGEALRQSHAFLHAHLNAPCPNAVIEAVSCGIPVIGLRTGAMPELMPFAAELLAEVSDDLVMKPHQISCENYLTCTRTLLNNYVYWRKVFHREASRFPFAETAAAYLEIFRRELKSSTRNVPPFARDRARFRVASKAFKEHIKAALRKVF